MLFPTALVKVHERGTRGGAQRLYKYDAQMTYKYDVGGGQMMMKTKDDIY